jgi:hypothetical protein
VRVAEAEGYAGAEARRRERILAGRSWHEVHGSGISVSLRDRRIAPV